MCDLYHCITPTSRLNTISISSKRQYKKLMPQVSLGKIPATYTSTIPYVSDKKLQEFVDTEIQYGPQIVSLQVPPERHAILVDIQSSKIMISDWNGCENEKQGLKTSKDYTYEWKQYSEFIEKLKTKYQLKVEFYSVDETLKKVSMMKAINMGGGGCSDYIFNWANKYYPEYK